MQQNIIDLVTARMEEAERESSSLKLELDRLRKQKEDLLQWKCDLAAMLKNEKNYFEIKEKDDAELRIEQEDLSTRRNWTPDL